MAIQEPAAGVDVVESEADIKRARVHDAAACPAGTAGPVWISPARITDTDFVIPSMGTDASRPCAKAAFLEARRRFARAGVRL
ncbi:hypothetical protein BE61_24890 [Bradyrhizobium elkanii USDA 61]|nr:hypothetical protein BE61_24890 [Bradyrhizobium elkanii USDA 61]